MKALIRIAVIFSLCLLFMQGTFLAGSEDVPEQIVAKSTAAIIQCKGMIDDGLYKSIVRRSEQAMAEGADYLIYTISTYGGLVKSADDISKYFILEIADKAHTVAYVETEAISAGSMISVSCNDIIMRKNTNIGDCAPIIMGQKLEGVEREKTESFIRSTFARAAQANNYPEILLKSMVTDRLKVYRIKNIEQDKYEFFDADILPRDANEYDLANKELVVKEGELLTLTAKEAYEFGIARKVVSDIDEAIAFLAERDGVEFEAEPTIYETSWSEEMVRLVNSPAVTSVLFMMALMGVYIEFKTPGIGLAGLVAVICFAIIFGSRFLVDLANWVEVLIFVTGIVLIIIEFFVIPGFGVAGVLGIVCILVGLFGMLIKNPPDKFPIPQSTIDWIDLQNGVLSLSLGFVGFVFFAWLLSKYLPKFEFFGGLALAPVAGKGECAVVMTSNTQENNFAVKVDDVGEVVGKLRPAGTAKFGDAVVDVVSDGEFVEKGMKVKITEMHGNRVIVVPILEEEK